MELEFTHRPGRAARQRSAPCSPKECPHRARPRRGRSPRTTSRPTRCGRTMVELGWPALTVAEEHGGIGLGAVELAILAEELGRVDRARARCSRRSRSYVPRCARPRRPSSRQRFLGAVAARRAHRHARDRRGDRQLRPGRGHRDRDSDGDALVLAGTKRFVIEGAARRRARRRRPARRARPATTASRVVRRAGRPRSTSTPIARARRQPRARDVDARRRARRRRPRARRPRAAAAAALRRALEEATVALALETVGTVPDDLRHHARLRQGARAVRRADRLVPGDQAQVRRHADRARAGPGDRLLRRAHDRRGRRAAHARRRRWPRPRPATASASLAKEGIQIHGGIGYTWEHDMHLYVRRVQVERGAVRQPRPSTAARIADLLGV